MLDLLMRIYQKLRLEQKLGELETEFAYHSLKHLMQLEERVQKHHQQLETRTLARLIVQAFEQSKIESRCMTYTPPCCICWASITNDSLTATLAAIFA